MNKTNINTRRTSVTHKLIVKLMKGDNKFRQSSNANIQFGNEIYIYTNVMENFQQFINESSGGGGGGGNRTFNMDSWLPKVYHCFCGHIPGKYQLRINNNQICTCKLRRK